MEHRSTARPPFPCARRIHVGGTLRYRLGYLALNSYFVVLVANIPGTFLWDPEAGDAADGEAFLVFLGAVALSILAFSTIQVCT